MAATATAEATAQAIAAEHGNRPDALIEILHALQVALGCVPEEAITVSSGRTGLSAGCSRLV